MSLAFAFVAGLVTFIDPCVIATIPAFLAFLTAQPSRDAVILEPGKAVLVEGGTDQLVAVATATPDRVGSRWPLVRRAIWFVAGFSTLFVVIGIGVIALGQAVAEWIPRLYVVGAVGMILLGLALLGRLTRPLSGLANRLRVVPFVRSPRGAYTMGLSVSVAWIPCVGPIMAVVASVAGLFSQTSRAVAFLLLFCLGLGLPFVLAAVWGEALLARVRRLGRAVTVGTAVAGVLMVLIGTLVLTHDGYEAIEHQVEGVYEATVPGLFGWREEAQYEEWWVGWFQGKSEGEEHTEEPAEG